MTKNEQEFKNMLHEVNSMTRRLNDYFLYYSSISEEELAECKKLNNTQFDELQALIKRFENLLNV